MNGFHRVFLSVSTCWVLTITPAHSGPQDDGSWTGVKDFPVMPIHTVMTPEGKVMNFGTDKNGLQGASFFFDVWDPKLGTGASSHNTLPNSIGVDSFCSAAILLPETGNILMSGGDNRPNGQPNVGINDAPIFNTQSNSLSRAANMSYARWYPTSTTLPNGNILITAGHDMQGRTVATPEVYSPANNKWTSLFGVTNNWGARIAFYPRQWVAPNGKVFGYDQNREMYYINTNNGGSLQNLGLVLGGDGVRSTAVMYQPGKILKVGGKKNPTNTAAIININQETPVMRTVPGPKQTGRVWVDSVVLPNGKVMIAGGSAVDNELQGVSFRPEIWDPATEKWTLMKAGSRARLYHSTAMLLKDGRVLVAGGGSPGPQTNLNGEIFSPPYLYNNSGQLASRPKITSAPKQAAYGSKVAVSHNAGTTITRATLIKTGAVTHSSNMEQRFLELDFVDTNNGVSVTMPAKPVLATPGYYLLHLLNNRGVPSEAHIIRISNTVTNNNPKPLGKDDIVTTVAGNNLTIDALANDIGNGLVLNQPSKWSQKGGIVELVNNKILYKPKAGFTGSDKIWYNFKDAQGRSNYGVIIITVTAANSGAYPTATTDNVTTRGSGSITINALANDTGVGLTLNTPNAYSQKSGSVKLQNNRIVYKPKLGFNGTDKVFYTFKDNQGRSNYGTIVITVSGNSITRPIATADNVTTAKNTAITIDILANDSVNSGTAIETLYAYTAKGGTTSKLNGKVRYKPKANYTGQDNFWYVMTDSTGYKSSAKVTINVTQ